MTKKETRKYFPRRGLLAAVIVLVAVVDQISKIIALKTLDGRPPVQVIGDLFELRLVFNPGAAFSFGTNATWVFTTLQLVYILAVAYFSNWLRSPVSAVSAGLIAGGALGNLIDRLFREPGFYVGHVVDFLSVKGFAVFNIADSAITIGVILLVIWMIFSKEPDLFAEQIESEKQNSDKQNTTAGAADTAAAGEHVAGDDAASVDDSVAVDDTEGGQ
ncbi:MAG: signal peptidase II [Corynebacterium sp.]|uniref:signal peptidase II n=1 Tax=Corynebacterium sp. TaxID=1720 RepID=UPI0026DC4FAE|nr:signal peptidase II [Corynebacterium sp.]MDO5029627.1 signal peptidase II [Corynebacterium sp.]